VPKGGMTRELLRRIAEANGTDINSFLLPKRRTGPGAGSRRRAPYRQAAMLPRLFRAYFALPGFESRLQALRMMEAMAARARVASGEEAL
jgi:hypothetical protein